MMYEQVSVKCHSYDVIWLGANNTLKPQKKYDCDATKFFNLIRVHCLSKNKVPH